MRVNISSEGKLLLSCARVIIDAGTQEQVRHLAKNNLDWSYFRKIAMRNRVLPLVFHSLTNCCLEFVPTDYFSEFQNATRARIAHNEENLGVLLETVKLFKDNEIPAVAFKGVTFALSVYGSLALRICGDVDLLVHTEDFLRAKDLLIRNGHRQAHFGHFEGCALQSKLPRDDGRPGVDLHYGLAPLYQRVRMPQAHPGLRLYRRDWNRLDASSTYWFFSIDCEPLWGRLGCFKVAQTEVPVFSPEDLLIVLSIGGMKENWRSLNRLCDIAELVRVYPDMNWDRVLGQMNSLRCERKLFLGLLLAHELLRMPLEIELRRRVTASPVLRSLASQIRYRLCVSKLTADVEEFRLLTALLTMDSLTDRLRYLRFIARRLRQLSFKPLQYLAFFRKVIWQIRDITAHSLGLTKRDEVQNHKL